MIAREQYMKQIRDFIDKPVVKIITGMRRCGKSVIMDFAREEIRQRGVSEKNIFYANFESLAYEDLKNYKALYCAVTQAAKEADGKLYGLAGDRGSDITYQGATVTALESATEDTLTFTVALTYTGTDGEDTTTKNDSFSLYLEDGVWKVDTFTLPY